MSNKAIRKVIEKRLKTWADARSPALPIAFENAAFSQPTGIYLQGFLLPADTMGDDLAGDHLRYQGIYQISIWANINTGPGVAEGIAEELLALFPLYDIFTDSGMSVWVAGPVTSGRAASESNRFMLPVTFTYRADTIQ